MRTYAILLSAMLSTARVVAAPERQRADLRLASGQGCCLSGDGASLWVSLFKPAGGTVYMEAEQALNLTMQPGKEVGRAPRCAGGTYIAFVTNAEFAFEVVKAGMYQGWARTYLPRYGSWNHMESMDAGKPRRISESARKIFGKWFWSKLGRYSLRPGPHTFKLHNWLGGARLDSVVFSRDPKFDPEGYDGVPAVGKQADRGTVTTAAILPSRVAKWHRLTFHADLNAGSITAEVSTDTGKTWTRRGPKGDLSTLKPARDGRDSLMARFTLAAAPDGRSPLLRSAAVEYALAGDAEIVVENQHYRIAVARATGKLCGLFNRVLGEPVTPLHMQEPFLGLGVREPGGKEMTLVPQSDMTSERAAHKGRTCTLRYSALDRQIRIQIDMAADDSPLCRWRYTIENHSRREIVRFDSPVIANAAIGEAADDECVIPRTGGWRIKNPAADKEWKTTYLGGGSMSWLDLCDSRGGLYVVMMDKLLTTTEMGCAPAAGQRGADLFMRTHTLVRPGQTKTREYAIGVHVGDWHWAADRYREWAYSWMKHPDPPRWVKDCDGWVQAMGQMKFDGMEGLLKRAQADGLNYIQCWGWMADGINQCCGNFYWPAPASGGLEGFQRAAADVHARAGRITAYMNCQTWTRDSAINDSLRLTHKSALPQEALGLIHPLSWFEKWRLCRLDGSAQGYYASTLGWYIMCPASDGFREHLRFWAVDMCCKRYGLDGVYIDQTGATAAKPCYDLDHGHDDIGGWGQANVQLLKTIIEQTRRVNADFYISIEGAGDALGQYADMHLISGLCTHPEVYHYAFPDHILISGLANRSHLSYKQRISRAFLNGDRFDARVSQPLITSALQLRRRIKRWLYPGRFMDTLGLTVSDARVLARWALCDRPGERAIVVTFDNEHQAADAVCRLELPHGWREPRSLHLFDREAGVRGHKPLFESGAVVFNVPKSTLSAALLMYETRPAHAVDAWCAALSGPKGVDTIRISAANLSDKPVQLDTSIEVATPLRLSKGPTEIALPAGAAAQWELRLAGVDQLTKPAKVELRMVWPGGSMKRRAFVRPLFVNGGLDLDDDNDGCPDFWSVGGTTRDFPYGMEDGAFWIQGQPEHFQYAIQIVPLLPETKYYFAGRIRRSGPSKQVSIAVVEFLEPGYRVHKLGGDESLPANVWQRFETTFATGKRFAKCAVYLYNTHSNVRAWYRDLELRLAE